MQEICYCTHKVKMKKQSVTLCCELYKYPDVFLFATVYTVFLCVTVARYSNTIYSNNNFLEDFAVVFL